MKLLLKNRTFMENGIQFYFYGLSKFEMVQRTCQIGKLISNEEASLVIDHLLSFFDNKFPMFSKLKRFLFRAFRSNKQGIT